MSRERELPAAIVTMIIVGVILIVGVAVLGSMTGTTVPEPIENEEFEPAPTGDVAYSIDNVNSSSVVVQSTLGRAVDISSRDGYVDLPANLSADEWTIAITADLDTGQPLSNATYELFGWNNQSVGLWLDDGDWYARVNDSGAISHARVAASDPVNDSTLTLDYSAANVLTLNASGSTATSASKTNRSVAVSWQGQLDEWRAWEGGTGGTTISQYHSDPVAASPDEPDARVAFHEGSGTTARIYYQGGSATLVRAGWGDGVDGPGLVEGTDYELRESGDAVGIVPLPGGYLDGQPFAFASSDRALDSAVEQFTGALNDTFALAGIVLILVIVIPVIGALRTMGARTR